jgi:hypothetical protein
MALGRPLVGLLARRKSRTRGSGADEGVRPTFGCGSATFWGPLGRESIAAQEAILPHWWCIMGTESAPG